MTDSRIKFCTQTCTNRGAILRLLLSTTLLLAFLSSNSAAFARAPSPSSSQIFSQSALPVYDVKLTVTPKTRSSPPGGDAIFTIESRNTKSSPFNVTGYILEVKPPGDDIYSIYDFSISNFSIIPAKGNMTLNYNAKVGPSQQVGSFEFVFYWTGIVNGVAMRSHECSFSLNVT